MGIKDSGTRRDFESGAVRDAEEGKGRFDLITPIALTRLAKHYEAGAVKYSARNWEKGIPLGTYLDSALRHINKHREGLRDEDHMAAALWNIAGFIHTEEMIKRGLLPKELDDLPSYMEEPLREAIRENAIRHKAECEKLIEEKAWMHPPIIEEDGYPEDDYPVPGDHKILLDGTPCFYGEVISPPPKKMTAYFSHHIRGKKGNDATQEDMKANREDAIRVCNQVRELLPNWEIYCPAEVDEVVNELLLSKAIGEKEILDADCKILERRDALFAYCKDEYVSRGMDIEIKHALEKEIPYFMFNELDKSTKQYILSFTGSFK